mgnify:CR=1 FL=1
MSGTAQRHQSDSWAHLQALPTSLTSSVCVSPQAIVSWTAIASTVYLSPNHPIHKARQAPPHSCCSAPAPAAIARLPGAITPHSPHGNVLLEVGAECSAGDLPDLSAVWCGDVAVLAGWCTAADETHTPHGHTVCQLLLDHLTTHTDRRWVRVVKCPNLVNITKHRFRVGTFPARAHSSAIWHSVCNLLLGRRVACADSGWQALDVRIQTLPYITHSFTAQHRQTLSPVRRGSRMPPAASWPHTKPGLPQWA